ncbi:cytochrome-c peroxidase [Archangium violaceum]|uniref:cytochrome-c peroxidase n=1 Tax=Archangium violaceum TaxID=83451 RepID=UPI0036D9D05B
MAPSSTKRIRQAAVAAVLLAAGCGAPSPAGTGGVGEVAEAHQSLDATGESLFRQETFGGNGRTCETCHGLVTGTVNPAELQALYQRNPNAPMFRAIDSDDGTTGSSYRRLLEHATVLVSIPLPSNTRLLLDPGATQLTLRRGIPSTLDTPALDPVLMQDGRAPSLTVQAHDAIMGHAQATREPTSQELASIASFEQTLFSSQTMKDYARTGVAPALPEGNTESEKRGRAFFRPEGACGQCHAGPLLNETGPRNILGQPQGSRFSNAFVSEINFLANPVYILVVQRPPLGLPEVRLSPDPGRFLITGRLEDFNHFKMSSLWNIKNTAPYFHDNSAETLEDVLTHYTFALAPGGILLSPRDSQDIIAWLKLL